MPKVTLREQDGVFRREISNDGSFVTKQLSESQYREVVDYYKGLGWDHVHTAYSWGEVHTFTQR